MIDLQPDHLTEVQRILRELVPGLEVRAFGSRVTGSAARFSDLDLVVMADSALNWRLIESLKDAFSESDLPFSVDVLDWHTIPDSFRGIISRQHEVIQVPADV